MVSYDNFLTEDECDYIINYTKKSDSILNVTPNRNLEFYHINDYSDFKFLEEKLNKINIINKPVFNINKYTKGYFFLPHIDKGGKNDPNEERIKTIIINLSDTNNYSGGDLYVDGNIVSNKKGMAILFDSSIIHEVTEITEGFRYSIAMWLKKNNIKESLL